MKTAVILAGGKGLRLYPDNEGAAKPMVITVNGRPILEYIIFMLQRLGFETLYVIVGYKKKLLWITLGKAADTGLDIHYIENSHIDDPRKNGLSDALCLSKTLSDEPFMTILG